MTVKEDRYEKTILVVVSKDIMRRNIIDTAFWPAFMHKNRDNRVVMLVEGGKEETYEKIFGAPNVTIIGTKKEATSLWHRIVLFLVRTGVHSHGVKLYRWRSFTLGDSSLVVTLFKSLISNTFARARWYKALVRYFYQQLSLDWIVDVFDVYNPHMVFAPSLIDINIDALVAVEARRRSIRVVGMVRSWDNLVIHGLLPFVPNNFIFQNKWLKQSAQKFQDIDLNKIKHEVIGLPHYDAYKNPQKTVTPKEDFFRSVGLDPEKRLIFLAGFDFYYSEDMLPETINRGIEIKEISPNEPIQAIFTQHPKSPFEKKDYNIDELEHVTYLNLFGGEAMGFLNTEETFINLVYHADVVVNVASTVSIDAAVFDRPAICVSFDDSKKKLPYWKQASRLHDSFDHYEALIETGGVKVARTERELVMYINQYLENPSLDREGRRAIIDKLVAPFDGNAGKRLADIVNEEIEQL